LQIVTIAAGAGVRMPKNDQSGNSPKFATIVGSQTLIEHSLASFHPIHVSNLINNSNHTVVVLAEHLKDGANQLIQGFEKNGIQVVRLENPTSGAAETAFMGVSTLSDSEEVVAINDCDHTFYGPSITSLVADETWEIGILLTNQTSDRAEWSYATTDGAELVLQIEEKAVDFKARNLQGVIGCYFFRSKAVFNQLWQAVNLRKISSKEIYLSDLVQEGIRQKRRVVYRKSKFGIPLGTELQLDDFYRLHYGRVPDNFASTFFVDLDGTLCYHETGPSFNTPNRVYPKLEIYNLDLLKTLIYEENFGSTIVITTARPTTQMESIKKELEKIGLKRFKVQCSIPSGSRYLINDTKPERPYLIPASTLNLTRNIPNNLVLELGKENYIKTFKSGSGASVNLMEKNNRYFVRKSTTRSENVEAFDILEFQSRWFSGVSFINPTVIPSIISLYNDGNLVALDLEFIEGTRLDLALHQGLDVDQIEKQINIFLHGMYGSFARKPKDNALIVQYLKSKAFPAIELFVREMGHPFDGEFLTINEERLRNPIYLFEDLEIAAAGKSMNFSGSLETMIHGDLTSENILVREGKPIFLDPLGSYMDSRPEIRKNWQNELTSPLFDLSKLAQSLKFGYELWESTEIIKDSNRVFLNVKTMPCQLELFQKITQSYIDVFGCEVKNISSLMEIALLARLLPWRLKDDKHMATICYYTLTQEVNRLLFH